MTLGAAGNWINEHRRPWDLLDTVARQLVAIRTTIPECTAGDMETMQHLHNIQRTCDECLAWIAEEMGG